jgi:xanthine dehydrogenase molybdopterin-binding subunit B
LSLFLLFLAVTEVELDVLSGRVHVLNSEIVYDCGQSLNPAVDIGQIEGGFVMGLGYFLTESVAFDSEGSLITSGTWS